MYLTQKQEDRIYKEVVDYFEKYKEVATNIESNFITHNHNYFIIHVDSEVSYTVYFSLNEKYTELKRRSIRFEIRVDNSKEVDILTELERKVLQAILDSDYQDSVEPVNYPVWYLDENDVNMKPGQLSGAISSCKKKGYVGIEEDGNDSTIWITEKGHNLI